MERHLHNVNPAVTVVAHGTTDDIGRRQHYSVNRLGDETREPQADGSVIVRRPVVATAIVDFAQVNDEALLAIVEDRLADRAASEFGSRRMDGALKHVRRALEVVRQDATKPMRRRAATAPGVVVDGDGDDAAPSVPAAPAAIPGMVVDPQGAH